MKMKMCCVALSGRGKSFFVQGQNLKETLSLGNVRKERDSENGGGLLQSFGLKKLHIAENQSFLW